MSDNSFKKIIPRIDRFIDELLVDENQTQAAIRAGYAKGGARQQASKLLTYTNIQEEIQKRRDKRAEEVGVTAKQVLKDLIEIKDRCMENVPVLDKKGNPTGIYVFDSNGAIRSSELLGKSLGMFVDRKKIELDGSINVYVEEYKK